MQQINPISPWSPRLSNIAILTQDDIIMEWKESKLWIKIFHTERQF